MWFSSISKDTLRPNIWPRFLLFSLVIGSAQLESLPGPSDHDCLIRGFVCPSRKHPLSYNPFPFHYSLIILSFWATDNVVKQKDEGKVVLVHAMKTYRGSRGIAPLIPSLGTRWWGVVNFTPRPLYQRRNNPRYPWSWKVGGASEPVWMFSRRQRSPASAWNRTPDLPPHRLNTVLTTMSELLVVKQALRK